MYTHIYIYIEIDSRRTKVYVVHGSKEASKQGSNKSQFHAKKLMTTRMDGGSKGG